MDELEWILAGAAAVFVAIMVVRARRLAHAGAGRSRFVIRDPRLGVLNLLGDEGELLVRADLERFGSLFASVHRSVAAAPQCDVLLLYCRIAADGIVDGARRNLRAILGEAGAKIAVVATENDGAAYRASTPRVPYGRANLVMTLGRKGGAFADFCARLFAAMKEGATMTAAWVRIAPQDPNDPHEGMPAAVFACEFGQIAFA